MALTKFVRNVDDLSDDGGYKFRFGCDRCNDGVESQYVSSSANILKTGLEIFSMFRPFGSMGRHAVQGVDRGLRGKERDAAYEAAVNEATAHFNKCSHCGQWVCAHCFNDKVGLCEGCAPDANEHAAKAAAEQARAKQVEAVRHSGGPHTRSSPARPAATRRAAASFARAAAPRSRQCAPAAAVRRHCLPRPSSAANAARRARREVPGLRGDRCRRRRLPTMRLPAASRCT